MIDEKTVSFVKEVLENMPADWVNLTTHRLDIYNEKLAKVEFLTQFENLLGSQQDELKAQLEELPTAFDYIRLGHPLSCILEWVIAKSQKANIESVISFSSQSMPILAILRKNSLENTKTRILHQGHLPHHFDHELLQKVYDYKFELSKVEGPLTEFDGSTILIKSFDDLDQTNIHGDVDFVVALNDQGSITIVNRDKNKEYISEIQHVRRRESIAMTPHDCLSFLEKIIGQSTMVKSLNPDRESLVKTIQSITNTSTMPSIGSCGLSVQYAIMMGLIHHCLDTHPGKAIKFLVPPNCYGGTNDQARRVAAVVPNVEIVDLPVDSGNDMVQSLDRVLGEVAKEDALAFIIAEIPTNPRVEVPDLIQLKEVLTLTRKTSTGAQATAPVFILDQTFCPNVKFLGEGDFLSSVATISYVSGSKFPSGGLCTAGYSVANKKAEHLVNYVERHLKLCDNVATDFQIDVLSKQMPSMNKRIEDAYKNTREFVDYIQSTLPTAKINFVSRQLAQDGFTPSVFSLDLPTIGDSHAERELHKRDLNLKLIKLMIKEIPTESKFCVSYGQLQGCYWTIPATSTQGTTKEGDKDYIVRVSLSPKLDVNRHKEVFSLFCRQYIN